jgi:predicted peroxiredoxin/TusA-related sulfurtransferase
MEIDGRGRSISTAIRDCEPGEETSVRTDALPAVDSDIHARCRTTGHELTGVEERDTERRYGIRKTDQPRAQPPWALVISDPGLEELLSPLGFALAAALGGSQFAIYFQGPAVRVPTRGFKERLKGRHRAPFSRFARRGLARAGHPPPHEKLVQLHELRARLYVCRPSMQHFNVDPEQLLFPEIRIAASPPSSSRCRRRACRSSFSSAGRREGGECSPEQQYEYRDPCDAHTPAGDHVGRKVLSQVDATEADEDHDKQRPSRDHRCCRARAHGRET